MMLTMELFHVKRGEWLIVGHNGEWKIDNYPLD